MTVECWLTGRFLELLGGHHFWCVVGAFSFPLSRYLLAQRLTSTNHYWCPMVVTSILKTCSSSTAYYLSRGVVQKSCSTRAAQILSAKLKSFRDLNITTATIVAARSQCPPKRFRVIRRVYIFGRHKISCRPHYLPHASRVGSTQPWLSCLPFPTFPTEPHSHSRASLCSAN